MDQGGYSWTYNPGAFKPAPPMPTRDESLASLHRNVAGMIRRLDEQSNDILDQCVRARTATLVKANRIVQVVAYLAGLLTGAGLYHAFGG